MPKLTHTSIATLTPTKIVKALDEYVIGQDDAKKAVAIALRNRYRRSQVPSKMRSEISPKNILMIGATGVGKTEIARRLAKLAQAPFVKVEASKYTEVGYVGRDVESMVRDLADNAYQLIKAQEKERLQPEIERQVRQRLLDALYRNKEGEMDETREIIAKKLDQGKLDQRDIHLEIQSSSSPSVGMASNLEDLQDYMQDMIKNIIPKGSKSKRKIKIQEARQLLAEEAFQKMTDETQLKQKAVALASENGVIFIDEIDKVAKPDNQGGSISREGVQRDLLPIIEGSEVKTKIGVVKTDYILFIAAGAFHSAKPSDLISELQGRFPIRVELKSLSVGDFERILSEPNTALIKQYAALMKVEGLKLTFSKQAISRLAEIAFEVNENIENIGARRLHTVMERLLETLSFSLPESGETEWLVDKKYVDKRLSDLVKSEDLSRYIL